METNVTSSTAKPGLDRSWRRFCRKPVPMTEDEAREIAVSGLSYIAADEDELGRFLALTGVDPADIRAAVQEPAFLAGVLDFFLGFEPALLKFAETAGVAPERVAKARHVLGGPPEAW